MEVDGSGMVSGLWDNGQRSGCTMRRSRRCFSEVGNQDFRVNTTTIGFLFADRVAGDCYLVSVSGSRHWNLCLPASNVSSLFELARGVE